MIHVPLRAQDCRGDVMRGNGRRLAFDEVLFAADRLVSDESVGHQ